MTGVFVNILESLFDRSRDDPNALTSSRSSRVLKLNPKPSPAPAKFMNEECGRLVRLLTLLVWGSKMTLMLLSEFERTIDGMGVGVDAGAGVEGDFVDVVLIALLLGCSLEFLFALEFKFELATASKEWERSEIALLASEGEGVTDGIMTMFLRFTVPPDKTGVVFGPKILKSKSEKIDRRGETISHGIPVKLSSPDLF